MNRMEYERLSRTEQLARTFWGQIKVFGSAVLADDLLNRGHLIAVLAEHPSSLPRRWWD